MKKGKANSSALYKRQTSVLIKKKKKEPAIYTLLSQPGSQCIHAKWKKSPAGQGERHPSSLCTSSCPRDLTGQRWGGGQSA